MVGSVLPPPPVIMVMEWRAIIIIIIAIVPAVGVVDVAFLTITSDTRLRRISIMRANVTTSKIGAPTVIPAVHTGPRLDRRLGAVIPGVHNQIISAGNRRRERAHHEFGSIISTRFLGCGHNLV